mgnify:CR=1 FL=1
MKQEIVKKIEKIVVNTGIGKRASQPGFEDKILPDFIKELALITGQKPMTRPAKKSISSFKVREGMIVGLKATLRSKRMADIFEKIVKVVLPRGRDFRGLSDSNVDASGNLNFGIREHYVFPEINPDVSKADFGLEITIVPKSVKSREEAIKVYREMGIPLKKSGASGNDSQLRPRGRNLKS